MGPIEQELDNFKTKLQEEMDKPEDERNQDQINFYTNTIASLELQLGEQSQQIQQHEERVQKQTEQLDGLAQQIQDMDLLGAIFPESQIQATNIGLTEWNEMRQSLNQILHAWATDLKQADYQVHNGEINALQTELWGAKEEVRASGERDAQWQRQYDELQKKLNDTQGELDLERNKREISETHFHALGESHQQRNAEVAQLKQQVEELNKQLEESNKPKPTFTTTESVQAQIEGLRKKSVESWAEKANRGLSRFNLPPIEAPALPAIYQSAEEVAPQGATFPVTEPESDQLPAAETVENVGATFQENTGEHSTGDGLQLGGDSTTAEDVGEAAVTREERFAVIEKRLDRLEKQAGIDERVA